MAYAFVAAAPDRAAAMRLDAAALAALRPEAACLWLDAAGRAHYRGTGRLVVARGAPEDAVFLGQHGGQAWFAATCQRPWQEGESLDLRTAASVLPAAEATLFAQARAILHWRGQHRFCPACAAALHYSRGGWQGDCPACGRVEYPRTDPAVIAAVSDGERLLLGRQPGWPPRRYSTLAGFVEPGETLEQALVREVYEETRVRIRHSRYLASQPWPFPSALMLGFVADAYPDVPQTAQDELEDAAWFSREAVQAALDGAAHAPLELPPRLSISRWLIERWVAGERAGISPVPAS